MKKMLKRAMALLVALIMVLSLAACGEPAGSETKAPETKAPDKATEAPGTATEAPTEAEEFDIFAPYEETVKLTFARSESTDGYPEGESMYDNVFIDFVKDYLNVEIEYEITRNSQDDYLQALNMAISGGELPDSIFLCGSVVDTLATVNELIANNMVCDITEVYEKYASDEIKEIYNSYGENCHSIVTVDGKLMGLQQNLNTSDVRNMVHIRQDWLDKLGIKLDEDGDHLITLEELETVLTEFVEKDPGNSGDPVGMFIANFNAKSANYSANLVSNAFGARIMYWYQDENGNAVDGSVSPEVKDALGWFVDMFDKGLIDPQIGITNMDAGMAMMANGRCGVAFGNNTMSNWFFQDTYVAFPEADFSAYGLDNGTGVMIVPSFDSVTKYVLISKDCENPEALLKVFSLVYTLAGNEEFRESIKDEYPEIYQAACQPGFASLYNPTGMGLANANDTFTDYFMYEDWKNGKITDDEFKAYDETEYTTAVKLKNGEKLEPSERIIADWCFEALGKCYEMKASGKAQLLKHLGVTTTPTMDTNYADMKECIAEWWIKIITGEVSLDEGFDSFVKEYNALGGEDVLNEVNELYLK